MNKVRINHITCLLTLKKTLQNPLPNKKMSYHRHWPRISVRQRKGVNLRWSQDYKPAVGTGAACNMPVFPVLLWQRPVSMTLQIPSNFAILWFYQVSKLLPRCGVTILLGDTLLLQAPKLPISVLEMKCNVLKELVFVPKSQQGVSYSP